MSNYNFINSFSKIPRFIQPRVRIFLSVDLVGSSKLKQAGPERIPRNSINKVAGVPHDIWLPELSNFYGAFPKIFAEEWARATSLFKDEFPQFVGYEPSLWKTNGDEIIFVKHVKDRSEIAFFVACWIKCIKRYKSESKTKLDVKSTGWCAGFPLNNSEIILDTSVGQSRSVYNEEWKLNNYYLLDEWYKKNNRSELLRDYIGPSIDIGFRLCELSSPCIFPVSVELAWFLTNQSYENFSKNKQNKINNFLELPKTKFMGEISLKGVFGGHPYPIFYVDVDPNIELKSAKDHLLGYSNDEDQDQKIKIYCEHFFETYQLHFPKPFIAQEDCKYLTEPPQQYIDAIKQLSNRFTQEKKRYEIDDSQGNENNFSADQPNKYEPDFIEILLTKLIKDITKN